MTLTEIIHDLENSAERLQDCDVEIDTDGITVSEFTYDSRYGVTVAIDELVEVYKINGERANKLLIIDEDTFDSIIDKLKEINSPDNTKMNYFLNEIQDRVTDIRILLGETHANHSER